MKKRTSYDTPEDVLIPKDKKFTLVFFGPPKRLGSFKWEILAQIVYEGACHPRHDDRQKGAMLTRQPKGAIAFKAYAQKSNGQIVEASPVHYYDGEIGELAKLREQYHDNRDLKFINDNYPMCEKVVKIEERFYPIEQRGSLRGGYISPVIEKMHLDLNPE